ncbi:MAG: hypothetical protein DI539_20235 [Flavobacterium psychrophilum]|nr:MAG: hypothetical protein DI539_20235 [Flavobacterium psychrophilum]
MCFIIMAMIVTVTFMMLVAVTVMTFMVIIFLLQATTKAIEKIAIITFFIFVKFRFLFNSFPEFGISTS